jgi:Protein-arginine deiminase (PAD)/Protein-arginine deiminase (PAD) middle domain
MVTKAPPKKTSTTGASKPKTAPVKKKTKLTPLDDKKRVEVKVKENPTFWMHIDADRDGKVDDNPNDLDKWEWGKGKKGAVILVNNNGTPTLIDHTDDKINGSDDLKDIAPLDIRRKGEAAPAGWTVVLKVQGGHEKFVRIFDGRTASGTEIIGPSKGDKHEFTDLNFQKKELGIEATRYAGHDFDGLVKISLYLMDASASIKGEKHATVRVAPWIMFNHLDKPERVFVAEIPSNPDSATFVGALTAAMSSTGLTPQSISNDDRWMQDVMDFGYSQIPGQTHLSNVVKTPRPLRTSNIPITLVTQKLGYVVPTPEANSSLNSGGNLECTPPFKAPSGKDYPFGRIYYCKSRVHDSTDRVPTEYADFLERQLIQKPIEIDAGWLQVGHVDEIISFVPAPTKLGFKLLLASPDLGYQILKNITATSASMLAGRTYAGHNAQMKVSDFLSKGLALGAFKYDAKFLKAYNDICQGKIKAAESTFTAELGLTASDIAYVPIVYVPPSSGFIDPNDTDAEADALTAGMVNMLMLDKTCIAPKPFGPVVGGVDLFEDHYRKTLESLGLTVNFIDDWDLYHLQKGEVHCGTNTLRKPNTSIPWWELTP